jgi:hypothetical protein
MMFKNWAANYLTLNGKKGVWGFAFSLGQLKSRNPTVYGLGFGLAG